MSLPAGSVKGAGDEIGNAAFSASFFYVTTQLQVTATSPAVGSILTPPVTDLVVQFNEAFNPYTISTSDFQLSQGTVVSAVPLTSQSVDLTLSGITQDGTLTLTVPAGVILDQYGVPNLGIHRHLHRRHRVRALSHAAPGQGPRGQPDLRPVGHRLHRFRGRHRYLHAAPGRRPDPLARLDDRSQPDRHDHAARPRRETPSRRRRRPSAGPTPCSRPPRSRRRAPTRWSSAAPAGRPATTRSRRSSTRLQAGDRHQQLDRHGLRPDAVPSPAWARPRPPIAPACSARSASRRDYYQFYLNAGQSATIAFKGTGGCSRT